jgi:cytochrome oxidase Cu insertion factor (SCO1/SenC/PrrC family)
LAKKDDARYRVISISIDPANDTPEQLRAWSAHFGAAPGWTLVTGKPRDIDGLLRALQVYSADKDLHSGNFLLGNPAADTWRRVDGTTAPTRLAEAMHEMAGMPKAVVNADVAGE